MAGVGWARERVAREVQRSRWTWLVGQNKSVASVLADRDS